MTLTAWSRARLAGTKLRDAGPTLSVPIVPQTTDWSCGAAALLSVLKYWLGPDQVPSSEAALWGVLGSNPVIGTDPAPIAGVASALGLSAMVRGGMGIADLPGVLASGATAILAIQGWGEDPSVFDKTPKDGHWVVLVGLDGETATFMDPSNPTDYTTMDLDDLARRMRELDSPGGMQPGLGIVVSR